MDFNFPVVVAKIERAQKYAAIACVLWHLIVLHGYEV